jgi:hypothetical protein
MVCPQKIEKQRIGTLINELISFIHARIPIKQINETSALTKMQETGFYPVRIAPCSNIDLLSNVSEIVQSNEAKQLGIVFVSISNKMHSSKFSSVLIQFHELNFGLIIAAGANKGETFEQELFSSMNKFLRGQDDELGKNAMSALQNADSAIKPSSIVSIDRRTGSTRRSSNLSSAEIIADMVITLPVEKKYISVKDENGSTVANFGISKAFNNDLSVNTASNEWMQWIAPFKVNAYLVTNGLQQYANKIHTDDTDEIPIDKKICPDGETVIRKLFGLDYIYLRKAKLGFESFVVNEQFINGVLNGMHIKSVTYPSIRRKQINIKCESEKFLIKLEIRNPSGQIKPKDLKMKMFKK